MSELTRLTRTLKDAADGWGKTERDGREPWLPATSYGGSDPSAEGTIASFKVGLEDFTRGRDGRRTFTVTITEDES